MNVLEEMAKDLIDLKVIIETLAEELHCRATVELIKQIERRRKELEATHAGSRGKA